MFPKLRHMSNPRLCLDNVTWRGNYLECSVCDSVVACSYDGSLAIMDKFSAHDDIIHAYVRENPKPDGNRKSCDFDEVKDVVKLISDSADSIRLANEMRITYDDAIPFDELTFDGEDSAAGDFYVGDDVQNDSDE